MICIDSSDFMRNGDFFPSRISCAQAASSLIVGMKMQSNPENTIGFLTMGGKSCTVRETLTSDVDRVMASTTAINVGGSLHFGHGMQIASLALSHRLNQRAESRVICFVGSPVTEDAKTLTTLAKKMRKNSIAVDLIAFGVPENVEILETFIKNVNRGDNSRFVSVPLGANLTDYVLSALGDGPPGGPGGAATGGGDDMLGGVDPNMDPELAMVLRMSLEEERRRIEAAAAASGAPADASPDAAAPAAAAGGADAAPAAAAAPAENKPLSEEEEFELALKLSLEAAEREAAEAAAAAGNAPATTSGGDGDDAPKDAVDPAFQAAVDDEEFLAQLEKDIQEDGDKKKPDDK